MLVRGRNNIIALYVIICCQWFLIVLSAWGEIGLTWRQEYGYEIDEKRTQKFLTRIDPEWNSDFSDTLHLIAIGRLRFDGQTALTTGTERPDSYSKFNGPAQLGDHLELSLRELYLDFETRNIVWRLGKQQVVWGQADGIKVLDLVNPQSYREFILDEFDYSRIPLWMLNAELPLGENSLQFLWIPDTTYHELPLSDNPYYFTSPLMVPLPVASIATSINNAEKPDGFIDDGDLGLRFRTFLHGWDLSANYFYHYIDMPVFYQNLTISGIEITPTYQRSHLIGTTFSNSRSAWTLRGELAYNSDTYHLSKNQENRGISRESEFAAVLGLDYQGLTDTLISIQVFQSHLLDYEQQTIRDQNEQIASLLIQRDFSNQTWKLEAILLYSLNRNDNLFRPKLSYNISNNFDIWLSADIFSGDPDGQFGQFDKTDRITLGLTYGI